MRHSKLKEYRIANGISRKQLGELVGVHAAAVWKWEHGFVTPRSASLAKILKLTHGEVTPNDFLTYEVME